MVYGLCNLLLQQFSFLYIQTLHNSGCSHIEDVHLLFWEHTTIMFWVFELRHFFCSKCLDGVRFVESVTPVVFIPLYSIFAL